LKLLKREVSIINKFISVYCRSKHDGNGVLCRSCRELHDYTLTRLDACPYDPKPPCKQCPTHCFKSDMRARMKDVMSFSGMYYVKRGRLDWLIKYFLVNKTLNQDKLNRIKQQSEQID
jgi:hypothetical protein